MAASEDLFRFVAMRDPQRASRPRLMRAMTYDPAENSDLHVRLRAATGDTTRIRSIADSFLTQDPNRVMAIDDASEVVRAVDRTLLLMEGDETRGGEDLLAIALGELRKLADDLDPSTSVGDLLRSPQVHSQWRRTADSFLAVTFASSAPASQVVDLTRILVIWALLERLAEQSDVSSEELDDLLRGAVVVLPSDVTLTVEREATPTRDAPMGGPPRTTSLERYERLLAAGTELRAVLAGPPANDAASAISVEPMAVEEPTDFAESGDVLLPYLEGLSEATLEVLDEFGGGSAYVVADVVDAAADRALAEHAALAALAGGDEYRRRAIAAELLRRRRGSAISLDDTRPVLTAEGRFVSAGRLLSAPVLGDLKVVRQTLAGYELGEIAHVENILAGERKLRRHRVVDVTETESIETERREEEHQHDLQTTTRSELATETQATVDRDESFNAGGTITASYGPYFSASATVGVAQSKSQSETTRASTRFAQDVTERASDRLRTNTERIRRSLTRNTISEENTHRMEGGEDNVVGVYRWVNKRYCAQVYDYGLRVLLDIGVPDPSVGYRYASQFGADLDVDADPPPPLVLPGTSIPLIPQIIGASNWQTLAATFRVADFPPPPAFWTTTPFAWSQEAPQQGATAPASSEGDEAPPPPAPAVSPRLFKSSREVTIPAGYQPLRFVAAVLVDGPSGRYGNAFTADERVILRSIFEADIVRAPNAERNRLRELLEMWMSWEPTTTPRPALTLDDHRLLSTYFVPSFGGVASPVREGLLAFMASSVGGFRPGLELAVGPTLGWAPPGAHKISGTFFWGQNLQPPEITTSDPAGSALPIAASTSGGQGFSLTLEVLSQVSDAEPAWQQQAYDAILAAHASWETDWRAAVAQAQVQGGVALTGRNPIENAEIIRNELKRSAIAMLGAPAASDLDVVKPGRAPATGGTPTAPVVDLERAARAARLVAFYEQAFEWPNMSYHFYPYFWTGRDDWPEALARDDPDPLFTQFLRAGSARLVVPIRPGFELEVGTRLHLKLPSPAVPASAPQPSEGPYLEIAEEIRAAQDEAAGGKPRGTPWAVVLPTTLVALDGTPMPTYPTACDPPKKDKGASP